jgi:hypothetical protein
VDYHEIIHVQWHFQPQNMIVHDRVLTKESFQIISLASRPTLALNHLF